MESWAVGFDGDEDVERHAGISTGAPARPALRVRLVSDYICPWCFVGFKRIEQLMTEYDVQFEAWAYDLRPGIPPEGLSREQAYAGRTFPPGYVDNLLNTAREAGIDMKRPSHIPNTRKAHEATEFAHEHGHTLDFHRAVFSTYWEREENIGDVEVLCRIAADLGMDADGLRAALGEGRYAAAVEEQMEWSRAAGITGVPTAIFNEKFALVGAQDPDVFRSIARRVIERTQPER